MKQDHTLTVTFKRTDLINRSVPDRIVGAYNNNLRILREVVEPHGVKLSRHDNVFHITDESRYGAGIHVFNSLNKLAEYCEENPIHEKKAKKQDTQIPKSVIEEVTIPLRKKLADLKEKYQESKNSIAYLEENIIEICTPCGDIRPKTNTQKKLMQSLKRSANHVIVATGPAGTGKTFPAVARAVECLTKREVDKIIIARPAVDDDEELGFLPGDEKDKLAPYMRPIYDALRETYGEEYYKHVGLDAESKIEITPLGKLRGRTLKNAFVILDEAQNTKEKQMKNFLTRLGGNVHVAICGDPDQTDLPPNIRSGLVNLLEMMDEQKPEMFTKIEFSSHEVIRSELAKAAVALYERAENEENSNDNRQVKILRMSQ